MPMGEVMTDNEFMRTLFLNGGLFLISFTALVSVVLLIRGFV